MTTRKDLRALPYRANVLAEHLVDVVSKEVDENFPGPR